MVQIQDTNGNWHDWKVGGLLFDGILYNVGAFSSIYPMSQYSKNTTGTWELNSSSITISGGYDVGYEQNKVVGYFTDDKINVDGFSTLKIRFDGTQLNASGNYNADAIVALSPVDADTEVMGRADTPCTSCTNDANKPANSVVSLDISSYSGEYYIFAGLGVINHHPTGYGVHSITVDKIWLE